MTENKRGRPIQTPDLDRVIEALVGGKYDDRILDVHEALQARREVLQDQLRARVREVFGPDADVVVRSGSAPATPEVDAGNPFIKQARSSGAPSTPETLLPDSGPYHINPDDGNSYRLDRDYGNGMVNITDIFGSHAHDIPKVEWESWEKQAESRNSGSDPLGFDGSDVPIENRGPIIGGISSSMMGN